MAFKTVKGIDENGKEIDIKLTVKQILFCEEYVQTLSAASAARKAGYSEKTLREIGCQNLTKVSIQQRIEWLSNNITSKLGCIGSLEGIVNRVTADITFNPLAFYKEVVKTAQDEEGNEVEYTALELDNLDDIRHLGIHLDGVTINKQGVSLKGVSKSAALKIAADIAINLGKLNLAREKFEFEKKRHTEETKTTSIGGFTLSLSTKDGQTIDLSSVMQSDNEEIDGLEDVDNDQSQDFEDAEE